MDPVGFHLPKQLRTHTASNPAVVQLTWSCTAKTNGKAPIFTFITTGSTSAGAPQDMEYSEDCISGITPVLLKYKYLYCSAGLMLKFPICCSDQEFILVL